MQRCALAAVRGLAAAVAGIVLGSLPGVPDFVADHLASRPAWAGDNDIVLSRLGDMSGGGVVANATDFRSLTSELGAVLAPRLLTPADTLGFGGFQFTADVGFTSIDPNANYWRARASSSQPMGGGPHGGSIMPTVGVFARKGIWAPLPSYEIGGGLVQLLGSRIMTGQLYTKIAWLEGYHDLPLPSLAFRGAVSRMMGESDLDLTVVSSDVSIGKEIGVGGTFNLTPYGGYSILLIIPRSELIDKTPHIADDPAQSFVFTDQDEILRQRVFAGARVRYSIFALTLEGQFTLAGSSEDAATGAVDGSSGQVTITSSFGLEF